MGRGAAKWLNNQEGYEFIPDEGGNDALIYYSGLKMDGFEVLEGGAKIEYDIVDGVRGSQTTSILVAE